MSSPGSSPPYWVVLSSANGSTNLGDEAMWEASVLAMRGVFGEVAVVTDGHPSFEPRLARVQVEPYLHLALRRGRFLRRESLARLVGYPRRNAYAVQRARRVLAEPGATTPLVAHWQKTVQGSVGVVISGAGAMTDDFAPHGIVSWWLVTRWAAEAGVPVALLGQGIGPVVDPTLQVLAAEILEQAAVVNVREQQSADWVTRLAPGTRPVVTADWALLASPTQDDRRSAASYVESATGGRPFVALSAHRRHNTRRADLRALSTALLEVTRRCREESRPVLFVPNMTGSGYSDDRATFDLLARDWPDPLRAWVHVVRTPLGARVTRALLGRAELVATTRYHPLVFAMAEETPSVGLSYDDYYDQKLSGASALFGVTDNVRRVRDADADWVLGTTTAHQRPVAPPIDENLGLLRSGLGQLGDAQVQG